MTWTFDGTASHAHMHTVLATVTATATRQVVLWQTAGKISQMACYIPLTDTAGWTEARIADMTLYAQIGMPTFERPCRHRDEALPR